MTRAKVITDPVRSGRAGKTWLNCLTTLSAILMTGCSMTGGPPESSYDQAEAYAPMEEAVADLVAHLPDFPGFERRSWAELPCSHNGVDDPDYTNIEIRYGFSDEASADPLVRETYLDVLRDYWGELGYDLHRDEPSGTGKFHSLEARRDDGINFSYSVGGVAYLMIQSGCVPRVERTEVPYMPPSGGIVPGSEQDTVAHSNRYFPDGVPEEQLTTPAVDPFASATPTDEPT